MAISNEVNLSIGGGGFAKITGITVTNGEITGFGTAIDLAVVTGEKDMPATGKSETETKEVKTTRGHSVKLTVEGKRSIDAVTGAVVAAGDKADKIEFSAVLTKAQRTSLLALFRNGTPVSVVVGSRKANGAMEQFQMLFGYFDGDTMDMDKTDDWSPVTMTVKGGSGFIEGTGGALTDINTAIGTAITPVGDDDSTDEVTMPTLIQGDYDTLLSGIIAYKDAS